MTAKKKPWVIYCTSDEDCTKQSFKDECDMNHIISRINKTGFVPLEAQDSLRKQIYGDASNAPSSLEDVYAIVSRADGAFLSLPAHLRERFGGPSGLLSFLEDPANVKEAQDLGLVAKPQPTPLSAKNSAPSTSAGNSETPDKDVVAAQEKP